MWSGGVALCLCWLFVIGVMPNKINATPATPQNLVNAKTLCAKLGGISRRTLGNWLSKRLIPSIKVGRVLLFDLGKVADALEKFENTEVTRR